MTTVDSDNLASQRTSANLRSYQAILTARTEQERETNHSAAQRNSRAVRRRTVTSETTLSISISDDTTDSDQTLSDHNIPTTLAQHPLPTTLAPTTQPTPRMPLPTDFSFFSGDTDDEKAEKPGSWLKRLERNWRATTSDADKIYDFTSSLDADSPAEEWWNKLDGALKTTWNDVKVAFRAEWPPTSQVEVSSIARRATMMSYKLTEDDIGRMEGEGRKRNYIHVIWADKVEPIWKQLEDKHGLLIPEVRANLPQGIVDCLPETKDIHTNFSIFLQAIREVPVEKAIRRTNEVRELRDMKVQLSALAETRAPPSPMSQMTQRLATSSLYTSYPQYTQRSSSQQSNSSPGPTTTIPSAPYVPPHRRQTPPHTSTPARQQPTPASSTNPFQDDGTTPRPQNLFYQNLLNTPSPTARQDSQSLAYLAVQNSRLYTDDDIGHQQYAKDIAAWESAYGSNVLMAFTRDHLPLTPGTVALGSQECYGCGKIGHTGRDCPLPEAERINPRERGWRTYITKILFSIGNRGTPTPRRQQMIAQIHINENEVIEYDPYLYPIETVTFQETGQGNGQESRE